MSNNRLSILLGIGAVVLYVAIVAFGAIAIYTGSHGDPIPPLFGWLAGSSAPPFFVTVVFVTASVDEDR